MTTDSGAPISSGFVALVGRPNAGKSTLLNALVGERVAIVSDKPQTTRHRLRGILDLPDAQIVLVDTPGLHKPVDSLSEEVNKSAFAALADVDAVCVLVDSAQPVGSGDAWVARRAQDAGAPLVLVMTKTDLVDAKTLRQQSEKAEGLAEFAATTAVSAVRGEGLDRLTRTLVGLLPEGPRYFPAGMRTDQPIEVLLAEFIREKVLLHTRKEVPHAVGVTVDEIRREDGDEKSFVAATVFVERESQKGILIGRKGSMIKRIGSEARKDLERILGGPCYLDLRVKVRKDWRRDASQIRRFGYGEGL
ncbi:MAG: GTPase Era [Coriobacteriia bacterium]